MTQEELSLLDESEREAWELERKATPGPWQEGWKNEHGAGCTGPRTAALCFASNDHLPIVIQPNAHKQSDNPEHWYGAAVARTAEKSDALFIAAARNLLPALLSKVARLTREKAELEAEMPQRHKWMMLCRHFNLNAKSTCVATISDRLEAAESRISDLTKEKDSAPTWKCFHCDFGTSDPKEAAAHFGDRDDAEEFKPLCKWWQMMDEGERAETLQDTIQQLNDERDACEAAESERDRYKERVGELEKFVAGIDPFCRTIHGDDECNWCGRERPRDIDKWQDAQREEHHNADCEFITILKGGN